MVLATVVAAIREYALSLITPLGAAEIDVALKAAQSGFRALSEFFTRHGLQYSLKTGRPFPSRLVPRRPSARSGGLVVPPSSWSPRLLRVARLPRIVRGASLPRSP